MSCASRNAKLAGTSISSLQRLVIPRALAKETLKDVLDVLRDCTGLSQDIQLKILQVLPSLFQNYAEYLAGDLLATALQICFLLFASKPAVIANTAAATLQQLTVSVFGKVAQEDDVPNEKDAVADVPVEDGSLSVRTAALDAYRLLNDVCLLTEGHNPTFLHTTSIPQDFGLEVLASIVSNNATTIASHPELVHIIRIRLMPFIIRVLSERVMFSTTVRSMRLLPVIFDNLLIVLSAECEMILALVSHMLEPDAAALWKRVLCMEILRGLHSETALVRRIYALYDEQDGKRNIIQDQMGIIVRLASEKPSIIGLGQQSSVPASSGQTEDEMDEMAALQADGVAGTFGVAMTLRASTAPGISARLSTMRVPCLDQLDKTEPPQVPPAYLYTLALTCMNNFSEGLTRFLQPFTVVTDGKLKRRQKTLDEGEILQSLTEEKAVDQAVDDASQTPARSSALKDATRVPVNPLSLANHALYGQIKTSAAMVETCWPALLAAYSTFFYAALDSEYFHALVRSFQKFTQISGLLRLSTPRDAFLTTLGKNAVPSGLLSVSAIGQESPSLDDREARRGGRTFADKDTSNAPPSSALDKSKRSMDSHRASLNTRNLLCLRALLNLGIALGPILDSAWSILLETLQSADLLIHHITTNKRQSRNGKAASLNDTDVLGDIGNEIAAVRVAATRMFESSVDLPDVAFLDLSRCLCGLFKAQGEGKGKSGNGPSTPFSSKAHTPKTSLSKPVKGGYQSVDPRANCFVVENLERIVDVNSSRLLEQHMDQSGWRAIMDTMVEVISAPSMDLHLRTEGSQLICKMIALTASSTVESGLRSSIRSEGLQALRSLIDCLYQSTSDDKSLKSCDMDIHSTALDTLKLALDHYGDSLAEGWDTVFKVIASVFEAPAVEGVPIQSPGKLPAAKSPRLVRSSFESMHLVCSDFLLSVPPPCMEDMLQTIQFFCRQHEEFNISLTATTLFGTASNHILTLTVSSSDLLPEIPRSTPQPSQQPIKSRLDDLVGLLTLLVHVTTDARPEIRQNAIHCCFSILEAWGDRLSSGAWMVLQQRVVLGLVAANVEQYDLLASSSRAEQSDDLSGWNAAAVLILQRASRLFVTHLAKLAVEERFASFWNDYLARLRSLLDRQDAELSGAIFASISNVLSSARNDLGEAAGPCAVASWELWHDGNPALYKDVDCKTDSMQNAMLSYVRCLSTVNSIVAGNIQTNQLHAMLTQIYTCATKSGPTAYQDDADRMTPLQADIMACVDGLDATTPGFASELLRLLSSLILLSPESDTYGSDRPAFVALSRASMEALGHLMQHHGRTQEIYTSGSFEVALRALETAISRKYLFPEKRKGSTLWKIATQAFVSIMEVASPMLVGLNYRDSEEARIWEPILLCIRAMLIKDMKRIIPPSNSIRDQEFDIRSLKKLFELLVPALGGNMVHSRLRSIFAASIFESSIIHEPHPDDMPIKEGELLGNLSSVHIGRVKRLASSRRSKVCYALLDMLFSLVELHDGTDERVRLAQFAAPYLILRVSIVLKAYVLDQPLRGRMPLAASQKREMLYILTKLVELECEPRAIPDIRGARQASCKHLYWVYGLVTKAIGVARRDRDLHTALTKVFEAVSKDFGEF